MATVNLSFTIPDSDLPDVLATLKQEFYTLENPTTPQLMEALRQRVMAQVANLTKQYRAAQVTKTVVAPVAT